MKNKDFRNAGELNKVSATEIRAALEETETVMRNNYLIGKAYVKGIGVERDPKRGVFFIEVAALNGLAEAAEYLSYMYEMGDGVKADQDKAAEWQKKANDLSKQNRSRDIVKNKSRTHDENEFEIGDD